LGGDFNCTENATLDRNHAEPHPASQHALRQLVYSHSLVDVWRRTHADCRQYTWSHLRERRISSARLDRFYVFKHHLKKKLKCKIMPTGFSFHSLIVCHVLIRDFKPKSAHWHFNSVLTLDGKFKDVLGCFGVFLGRQRGILVVLGSGGTMERLKFNFNVSRTPSMSRRTSFGL
jgi:hypothetical protein